VLSVDASSLKVGAHTCTLTVEDPKASNSPQEVTVTVYIARTPIHVPAQVDTIQEAIDHVLEGGSVIVADGIYTGHGNRDINFKGKAVTVRSENGPENCIIDCNGAQNDSHRGFYFHSNEDANSILDGFTIRNGLHNNGGAVYCAFSSPRIINCIISGNSRGPDGAEGGGIYCTHSSLILEDSIISSNTAAWERRNLLP